MPTAPFTNADADPQSLLAPVSAEIDKETTKLALLEVGGILPWHFESSTPCGSITLPPFSPGGAIIWGDRPAIITR